MFVRGNDPIMTFRVYDSYGSCVSDFTGTLREWQEDVALRLITKPDEKNPGRHLRVVSQDAC